MKMESPPASPPVSPSILSEVVAVSETPEKLFQFPPKRTRKQSKPKHVTELAETSPAAVVSKKMKQMEKHLAESDKYKQFAKANDKVLKSQTQIVIRPVLELFKKELADPSIIKAYLLPLFHFLDEYSITIEGLYEFENIMVTTSDGVKKLEKLRKLPEECALPEETMVLFESKYGKKYWKIPRKDMKRVKDILAEKKQCTCFLIDVEINEFENDGGRATCLTPRFRYE